MLTRVYGQLSGKAFALLNQAHTTPSHLALTLNVDKMAGAIAANLQSRGKGQQFHRDQASTADISTNNGSLTLLVSGVKKKLHVLPYGQLGFLYF